MRVSTLISSCLAECEDGSTKGWLCFGCALIESLPHLASVKLNMQQGVRCVTLQGSGVESQGCEYLVVNSHFLSVKGNVVTRGCRVGDILSKIAGGHCAISCRCGAAARWCCLRSALVTSKNSKVTSAVVQTWMSEVGHRSCEYLNNAFKPSCANKVFQRLCKNVNAIISC